VSFSRSERKAPLSPLLVLSLFLLGYQARGDLFLSPFLFFPSIEEMMQLQRGIEPPHFPRAFPVLLLLFSFLQKGRSRQLSLLPPFTAK